jgi:UDP-glucose 4-epimerase
VTVVAGLPPAEQPNGNRGTRTALVTGGAGFIGSNLVDALLADGWSVDVVDNLSTGRESNLEHALGCGARLHRVDLRDGERLQATVAAARPQVIFHLAAQIDVRRSVADPAFDARTNFEATYQLLEAARLGGVEHIVYSSTGGAVYGAAETVPTPEDAPIQPLSPYGQSKFAAEGAVALYARLYGLGATVLRYANVYGPRQDPLGEGGVIAIFCGRAVEGGVPVIYGDGLQTRDYTFVGDVVAANLLAAQRRLPGPFNVGTGRETTVVKLLETLVSVEPGSRIDPPRHEPARVGEVLRSCLDVARAERELGWQAQTRLEDGLRLTLEALSSGRSVPMVSESAWQLPKI